MEKIAGANGSTLIVSILLPLSYVSLVQLFDYNGTNRNEEKSIRKRFFGAILSNLASISITYYYLKDEVSSPFLEMGIRFDHIGEAISYPMTLGFSLYFGQFVMMYIDRTIHYYFDIDEWKRSFRSLQWIRDIIVGPITEEIAFRCCSAVLMNRCLGAKWTLFCAPLPFAISHFHHIFDDQRRGHSLAHSILQRTFQFCYTFVFGLFVTHLMLTTRHFIVPIVAHMICNSQGLPLYWAVGNYPNRRDRFILYISYTAGLLLCIYQLKSQHGMPTPNF
ncbi:unnamed protein product [Caenorhabditis bovis]|uniref:CAAX prenyl protease 2 n=1 Tax=Caenorhabditis bovis TaxID=2654633 RepID=A0A8S1EAN3_9PELO|nr:unnamed protein product [Caenorhabditis bovis]